MRTLEEASTARALQGEPGIAEESPEEAEHLADPTIQKANARLEQARQHLISAALAYGDGLISEGQLKAVRELLRERELRYEQLVAGRSTPPFKEPESFPPTTERPLRSEPVEPPPATPAAKPKEETASRASPISELPDATMVELSRKITDLEHKMRRIEQDFQRGRINPMQYEAVRRHYSDQQEVAKKLQETHPDSEKWRVVLQEGKTNFLLQLNEAACWAMAIYDTQSRERLYLEGELPAGAEESMSLLRTFGSDRLEKADARIYATETDNGCVLNLIPGRHTAALLVFSGNPPAWQLMALQEVHRHFEAANKSALARGERRTLIFPDLGRIVRKR